MKIPPMVAETIALCVHSIQAASQYARAIVDDPECPVYVSNDFLHVCINMKQAIERIDRRIGKDSYESYQTHIRDADALILDNIKSLFVRMTVEQKQALEMVAEAILKNEFILEHI